MPVINTTERIRALNDELRRSNKQRTIMLTAGVAALAPATQLAILAAVRAFDSFDADNDPHGEHDFGALTVAGERVFFKIDYYDRSRRLHSPDPADPAVTCRVLTVMLADEY